MEHVGWEIGMTIGVDATRLVSFELNSNYWSTQVGLLTGGQQISDCVLSGPVPDFVVTDWRPRFDDVNTIIAHALNWERQLNDAPRMKFG